MLAYAASNEVRRGFAKGAAAWLNDDRWATDDRTPNPRDGPNGGMSGAEIDDIIAEVIPIGRSS